MRSNLASVALILIMGSGAAAAPPELPGNEPAIVLTAMYPGAGVMEVEAVVAVPLEVQLNGLEGLASQVAVCTREGELRLTLTFTKGTDLDRAMTQVQKRVAVAQPTLPLEVQRLGPFLVEGDRRGRSLFALANREINARLGEVYAGLPPYALGRFGETTARTDEVV